MSRVIWIDPYTEPINNAVEVFTEKNLSHGVLNPPVECQGPTVLLRGVHAPPITAGPHIDLRRVTGLHCKSSRFTASRRDGFERKSVGGTFVFVNQDDDQ